MGRPRIHSSGWYRVTVGKTREVGGLLAATRFYISRDPKEFELKKAAINARWQSCLAAGHKFWPEDELKKLIGDGLVRPPKMMRSDTAIKLVLGGDDPLTKTELEPFSDENGQLKVEAAVPIVDLMARRIVTRLDFRIALYRQLWEDGLKDPKGMFEWCNRCLGWTSQQTSALLNLNINNGANPIAFNAFDTTATPVAPVIDSGGA